MNKKETIEKINKYFKDTSNKEIIKALEAEGVVFKPDKNDKAIREHIKKQKARLHELEQFWRSFRSLHNELGFGPEAVYNNIQAKVSSRLAFLQKSINQHQNLLNS